MPQELLWDGEIWLPAAALCLQDSLVEEGGKKKYTLKKKKKLQMHTGAWIREAVDQTCARLFVHSSNRIKLFPERGLKQEDEETSNTPYPFYRQNAL